jgi:hypothetical protein
MLRYIRLFRSAVLVLAIAWFVGYEEPTGQTVGWCESWPGRVDRVGFSGPFPQDQTWGGLDVDNQNWHKGGRNTYEQCQEAELAALAWCTAAGCPNAPGITADEICAQFPTTTRVENWLYYLTWDPEGYEAYQIDRGGQHYGSLFRVSFCCQDFGLNCSR